MREVVLLSFTAALNPTLLTATTVMLLLPHPTTLMLGYLLGALLVSITLGLLIVFALQDSSVVGTTQHTLSPVADLVLGGIALVIALVLGTEREKPYTERRASRRKDKDPPKWRQALSRGTARTTFVIGICLTLPGASYIAGMTKLAKLDYSTAETVLIVIGFNVVMLSLLELPLLAFRLAPDWTPHAIDRTRAWAGPARQEVRRLRSLTDRGKPGREGTHRAAVTVYAYTAVEPRLERRLARRGVDAVDEQVRAHARRRCRSGCARRSGTGRRRCGRRGTPASSSR